MRRGAHTGAVAPVLDKPAEPVAGPGLEWRPQSWWTHPVAIILLVTAPLTLLGFLVPENTYWELWRVPKYLDGGHLVLVLAVLLGLLLGCGLAVAARKGRRTGPAARADLGPAAARLGTLMLWLVLVGYAAWVGLALSRGLQLSDVAGVVAHGSGDFGAVKGAFAPVAGVTTLTQFSPVAATLLTVSAVSGRRSAWGGIAVLGALAGARALVYAERLALIEVLLPVLLVLAVVRNPEVTSWWTPPAWLLRVFPLLAPVALVGGFAVFEATRSWAAYYSRQGQGFAAFVLERITGYYATATNNGAIVLEGIERTGVPWYSMQWVWDFPVVSQLLSYERVAGQGTPASVWSDLLVTQSNPEFTSAGGVLTLFWDYPLPLAVAVSVVIGFAAMALHDAARSLTLAGLVALPLVTITLLELPRFFYPGLGRAFPAFLVVAVLLHRGARR